MASDGDRPLALGRGDSALRGDGIDAAGLQALDAREQRGRRGVDVGPRGLHQRELQAGAPVGARTHGLHRRAERLEQAHDESARHSLGLRRERGVGLGRQRQLARDFAQRLHDEQLARAHLQVAGERRRLAALLGALGE